MTSNRNNNDNNVRINLKAKIEILEERLERDLSASDEKSVIRHIRTLKEQLKAIEKQISPESMKSSGAELLSPLSSLQSQSTSTRDTVVLDGSNVVHGGAEGQGLVVLRLTSAIEFYKSKGYSVIAILRKVTFEHIKWKNLPNFELLEDLRNRENLHLADEDDLVVIDIALKEDAWIITQDTFSNDKEKDGETVLSERKRFPDLPWDDIDERTRGTEKLDSGKIISSQHWSIVGENFSDPTMPDAAPPLQLYLELRERAREITRALDQYYQELVGTTEPDFNLDLQKSNVKLARECMEKITQSFQLDDG